MSSAPPRALAVIYAVTVLYTVVLGGVLLLVPLYAIELGYSILEVGGIVALQAVLQIGLRIPVGWVCQSFGEKRTLVASFVALAITSALLALAASVTAMVAAQLIMGFSRAVFFVSIQSYATRISEIGGAGRLGKTQGLQAFGQTVGPLVAGLAAAVIGFIASFYAAAVIILAAIAMVLVLPAIPTTRPTGGVLQLFSDAAVVAKHPDTAAAGLLTLVAAFLRAMIVSFFPVLFAGLGFSTQLIGGLMSFRGVVEIAASWWAGHVLDAGRHRHLLIAGFMATFAGLAIASLTPWWWAQAVAVALVGAASSVLHVEGLAVAADAVERAQRGLAVGVNGTYWAVGLLIGPVATGWAGGAFGLAGGLWGSVGLTALAFMLSMRHPRFSPRPRNSDAPQVSEGDPTP